MKEKIAEKLFAANSPFTAEEARFILSNIPDSGEGKYETPLRLDVEAKTLSAACGMDDEDAVKMSKELAEQLLRTSNPLDFVNNVIPTLDTKKKLFVLTHGIRTIAESGTIEMIKESMMNGLGTLAKKFGMDIKDMGEGEE